MSMPVVRLIAIGATMLILLVLGCSARTSAPPPPPPAPVAMAAEEAPEGPVIVRIVGRHPTITVTAGENGPRYSAQADDGRMIVANATLDELWADHPDIARFVEPALVLDARMDAPELPNMEPGSFRAPPSEFQLDSFDAIDARR